MEGEETYETSPVPGNSKQEPLQKKALVDFYTALKAVATGKKATRLDWRDAGIYIFIRGEMLHIKRELPDNPFNEHVLKVTLGDMTADDWIILD